MKNFTFTRPDCLAEALKVKERGGVKAHVLAGGTNLMSYIKKGVFTEGALIDITRLDELKAVARSGDTLEIGACATITELLENPLVTGTVPFFAGGAAEIRQSPYQEQGDHRGKPRRRLSDRGHRSHPPRP